MSIFELSNSVTIFTYLNVYTFMHTLNFCHTSSSFWDIQLESRQLKPWIWRKFGEYRKLLPCITINTIKLTFFNKDSQNRAYTYLTCISGFCSRTKVIAELAVDLWPFKVLNFLYFFNYILILSQTVCNHLIHKLLEYNPDISLNSVVEK